VVIKQRAADCEAAAFRFCAGALEEEGSGGVQPANGYGFAAQEVAEYRRFLSR